MNRVEQLYAEETFPRGEALERSEEQDRGEGYLYQEVPALTLADFHVGLTRVREGFSHYACHPFPGDPATT